MAAAAMAARLSAHNSTATQELALIQKGDLYIADTGNQRIRRVRMGLATPRCHP
jgi:hypothetical protein